MEETLNPARPLDKHTLTTLLNLYHLVLSYYTTFNFFKGICSVIHHMYKTDVISIDSFTLLINHFRAIPRPIDANHYAFNYYWHINNTARRIEFLKEIIEDLNKDLINN